MAVFPTGSTWIQLDPVGIWLDLVPVEPTGNSLPTGIQVENLEGVPCLFGRYPTQKIPVGIHPVPTGSGRNLWGTVKTSPQRHSCFHFNYTCDLAVRPDSDSESATTVPQPPPPDNSTTQPGWKCDETAPT